MNVAKYVMENTLDILICTANERISQIKPDDLFVTPNVRFVIAHQVYGGNVLEDFSDTVEALAANSNIEVYSYYGSGLSVNRNIALDLATADFVLITDDDVQFPLTACENIFRNFNEKPQADVITFRIKTPAGSDLRNYKKNPNEHTTLSLLRVCSIEIAFRRQAVIDARVRFNEDFGLNAKYPSCEEVVFLTDLKKRGLKILSSNSYVGIHEQETSGANYSKRESIRARGELFKRLFGVAGIGMCLLFAIKHHHEYKRHYSFMQFLKIQLEAFSRNS